MLADNYETSRVGRLYLESVPMSHYGSKAVIPLTQDPRWCRFPVRRLPATSRHTPNTNKPRQGEP